MKKFVALLIAIIIGMFSTIPTNADTIINSIDTPIDVKYVEWAIGYNKRCRSYNKIQRNWMPVKRFVKRVALAPLMLFIGTASAEGKMDGVNVINNGNPVDIGETEGYFFTVSPSTAKKNRAYYTDKYVSLTEWEKKMPGVVVAQNRGMIFSSCRKTSDKYVIPKINDTNLIIVDEKSRILKPINGVNTKISWKGNGEHEIKDVIADGQGQHWYVDKNGKLAIDLWLKVAKFGYGIKGMIQPGLATDIGCKVIDHWGVERTITIGNTILMNSSMVKGLSAYNSLEELIEHAEMWGLTTMFQQWESGSHKLERRRKMGTQPNSTNLTLTEEEITDLIKPEARKIWTMQFPKVAWMKLSNINTSRGRAFAARPNLVFKDLIINQINSKSGNDFRRLAQGKFMAEGQYLKMYMDKLVFSYVYVHNMEPNKAAKKASSVGIHGEIRVNPFFADRRFIEDENGITRIDYGKTTKIDSKGRFIEVALVRYPHGAPSETIIVKAYLDETVPKDVIVFPAPAADETGTINVESLYALRLQGADFDGDAVTAFTERIWLEAQRRNQGKPYMIIPINTESTEKDKTPVDDNTWKEFCCMKVTSLSNKVGLIATSLKYFLAQKAEMLRNGDNPEIVEYMITEHACAMGDDIDEFKHGKAQNGLVPFVVPNEEKEEILYSPYFNRYAAKYKTQEKLDSTVYYKGKNGKVGAEKKPGKGILDMYAVATENLMNKCGISIVKTKAEASDGTDRFFYTVNPAQWKSNEVDLYTAEHGFGSKPTRLPEALEKVYGIKAGTTLTAKDLFNLLYRDHAATCKTLKDDNDEETDEGRDAAIKAIERISEKYALAKIAIVSWTKKMIEEHDHETINAAEAMRIFATLMTQHNKQNRSVLDNLTKVGTFKKADGSEYRKTEFAASRLLNYFLDVCGDGLLLMSSEEPNFPEVSEKFIMAAEVSVPDLDDAMVMALKELAAIDKVVGFIPNGIEEVYDGITKEELAEILDDSIDLGSDLDDE